MDIDSMEASRALDALVAEHVMGWVDMFVYDDGIVRVHMGYPPCEQNAGIEAERHPVPDFSTDIAAAWSVAETLRAKWKAEDPEELFFWRLESTGGGWCAAILWSHHDGAALLYVNADAATLSLAICRAALKALAPAGTGECALCYAHAPLVNDGEALICIDSAACQQRQAGEGRGK